MPTPSVPRFAIVLAGGRSSRMGVDKLVLTSSSGTMLGRTCAAAATWAQRVIVAGPKRSLDGDEFEFCGEEPPLGGPVAGLMAGTASLAEERDAEVLVLAGDLTHPDHVVKLLASEELGVDGVAPADSEGRPQYLAARYRLASLRSALGAAPRLRDIAVWRVLSSLQLRLVPTADSLISDLDTPEDAQSAGFVIP